MDKKKNADTIFDRLGLFSTSIDALLNTSGSKQTINSIASKIRSSEEKNDRVVFELRYPNPVAGELFINNVVVAKTSDGSLPNQVAELIGKYHNGDFVEVDMRHNNRNIHTILGELIPEKTFRDLFFPKIKASGFYLKKSITQNDIIRNTTQTVDQMNKLLDKLAK